MAITASFDIMSPCFLCIPVYFIDRSSYAIVNAMTAFWACRRFSASSKTTEFGPSMHFAGDFDIAVGRQWMHVDGILSWQL